MSQPGADRPASLESLVEALGQKDYSPGIGATAGLVAALAARLIEAVARSSSGTWDEAAGAIAQAGALRRRGLRLAGENTEAYLTARAALDDAREDRPKGERELADLRLGAALAAAADVPLGIAATAADAAELGAVTAEHAATADRPDAAGAALLAAGAAAAAAQLVEVNLATMPEDKRISQARRLVSQARSAGERALAASH